MELTECEAWICVNSEGEYAVGADRDTAADKYEEEIGVLAEAEGIRFVQVTVKVPMPTIITVAGEVPDTEDSAVLAVKNQS